MTSFKIHWGVTQWYTLPLTIFSIVVDTVIFHWVTLVAGEEAVPDGFGQAVQWLATFFYANDGLITSPRPAHIQEALGVLTGLFDRVGLNKNVNKTIEMVCQPCHFVVRHSEVAYMRRMTGVVPSFQERQQEIVWCPYCKM